MSGFIYVIDTGIGLIKIGRTTRMDIRMYEHRRRWPNMGILTTISVRNCVEIEKSIFYFLKYFGVMRSGKNEMFQPNMQCIKLAIKSALFGASKFDMVEYKSNCAILNAMQVAA